MARAYHNQQGGRAARFGYDAAVLVAYLDSHRTRPLVSAANGVQRSAAINGVPLSDASDGRQIRRWRSGTPHYRAVTLDTVDKLLTRFNLSITEFEDWAESQGMEPVLRGR